MCDYACLMFTRCLKCHGCFTATSVICSAGGSEGGGDDRKVRQQRGGRWYCQPEEATKTPRHSEHRPNPTVRLRPLEWLTAVLRGELICSPPQHWGNWVINGSVDMLQCSLGVKSTRSLLSTVTFSLFFRTMKSLELFTWSI